MKLRILHHMSFFCVIMALLCLQMPGLAQTQASIDDVLGATKMGALELNSDNQGQKTYTAQADFTATIESLLQTYGRAELSVELNGETIMQWRRNDDKDPAKLIVNGDEIEGSNVKVDENDYTPEPQKTKIEVKKGDKLTLNLNGNFGNADSYLRLIAPGLPGEDAADNADEDADGKIIAGAGGGFLWKPVSESRGGVCVILLPSKYRHEQFTKKLWINGQAGETKDWRSGYANGNRMHVFLKRRGEAYGGPVTIEFGLKSGARLRWQVADGARRTEK